MEIPNPRRILLVGQPDSPILDLLKDLTGTTPTIPDTASLAGTSHSIPLKTAYYKVTVPIWIDIPGLADPASPTSPPATNPSPAITAAETTPAPHTAVPAPVTTPYQAWTASFLHPTLDGASDVLASLGAFVVAFRKPASAQDVADIKALLSAVRLVVEGCGKLSAELGFGEWDGVCLAVGLRRSVVPGYIIGEGGGEAEEWEDVCRGFGFEFVDGEVDSGMGGRRDEFGELQGIARLKEALEANDWAANDEEDDFGLDDFGDFEGDDFGIGAEAAELEMELFGMKRAIYEAGEDGGHEDGEQEPRREDDEDQEDEVEKLEALILRMQAVKDMGTDMPEAERKKFAAKAVKDIMKTL